MEMKTTWKMKIENESEVKATPHFLSRGRRRRLTISITKTAVRETLQ
jgi:hypothetical protein